MGQKAPAAPDYAAANRTGIETQAEMLPLQIGVDRAARMGSTYTDPMTGRTYNFEGMGDEQLNALDAASTERLMQSGADIQRNLTKDQYSDLVDLLPKYNQLNLDMQRQAMDDSINASGRLTKNQYDQDLQYRPLFGDLQRSEDAKTYAANLDLGDTGARRAASLQEELLPGINRTQLAAQLEAARAGKAAETELNPERAALRTQLGQKLLEDVSANGLTDLQREDMEQKIRGSQAARGNILGAGAGYDESREVQRAGEDANQSRRAQALAYLSTPDLGPQFQAAQAVNPLSPNYQSASPVTPQLPNFAATTTGGPNLNPANINSSKGFNYVDAGAGAAGANYAKDIWNTKVKQQSEQGNQWMQGLGLATSAASMMMM